MEFTYHRGGYINVHGRMERVHETLEASVYIGGYPTQVVIMTMLLLAGVTKFPCGNGDDYRLSESDVRDALFVLKAERAKLTDTDEVKTLQMWQDSGLDTVEDYFRVGDKVSEDVTDYLAENLQPHNNSSTCFQPGEAYGFVTDTDGKARPTFLTFHRIDASTFVYDGICFSKQNDNVIENPTQLGRALAKMQDNAGGANGNRN